MDDSFLKARLDYLSELHSEIARTSRFSSVLDRNYATATYNNETVSLIEDIADVRTTISNHEFDLLRLQEAVKGKKELLQRLESSSSCFRHELGQVNSVNAMSSLGDRQRPDVISAAPQEESDYVSDILQRRQSRYRRSSLPRNKPKPLTPPRPLEPLERCGCRLSNPTAELHVNCAICLSTMGPGDVVVTLRCMHLYHKLCLEEWIKRKRLCPLCKHGI
eukprot:Rmarinus@m.22078